MNLQGGTSSPATAAIVVLVLAAMSYFLFRAKQTAFGWIAAAAAVTVAFATYGAKDNLPAAPTEPGCYLYTASGCPKTDKFNPKAEWMRDEFGERELGSGKSDAACAKRAEQMNRHCGAADYKHHFNYVY